MGSDEFDNDAKNFSERTFSFVTNIGIFAADAADGIRIMYASKWNYSHLVQTI